MNIGNNIKQIRELKNFSQEYMASEIEVSQSTYSRIESGTTPLKIDTLQRIADVLEVDLSTLLSTTNIFHFNKTANQCGFIHNQTNNTFDKEMLREIIQEELKKI
jgi:transcriptional regulator with XRE-family HTH domain